MCVIILQLNRKKKGMIMLITTWRRNKIIIKNNKAIAEYSWRNKRRDKNKVFDYLQYEDAIGEETGLELFCHDPQSK